MKNQKGLFDTRRRGLCAASVVSCLVLFARHFYAYGQDESAFLHGFDAVQGAEGPDPMHAVEILGAPDPKGPPKTNVAPKNQVITEALMQSMASDQSCCPWLMPRRNMKPAIIIAITLVFCGVAIAAGNTKLLTADPLTNLPLYAATDSRLHLGNEPTRLPEANVCGSKMQTDFYVVYDSKVDATLVWYGAHLPGFKKTHAYAANRSQDTFYNAERTLTVSVSGSSGKADENTETYSVTYSRFQPALPEKAIIGLNQQKVICQ
jgi:hypothetical protein